MDDESQAPETDPVPSGETFAPPLAPSSGASQRHRLSHRLIVVGALIVAVAAVVVVVVLVAIPSDSIGMGPGTATFTWSAGNNFGTPHSTQSFSGQIEGHSVSGVATSLFSASSGPPSFQRNPGETSHYARWTGTFAGQSFDLTVSLRLGGLANTATTPLPEIVADGHWGHDRVHAIVIPPSSSPTASTPIDFNGTVGNWKVNGRIFPPKTNGHEETVRASFVVSH